MDSKATVAPELLTDLLRDDLGFNGVILTDASLMVGLTSALPRERQMVQAITAGCDMILFFRNHDEDFGFVRDAIRSGEISADRLDHALRRILGLKAKLGLHRRTAEDLVPLLGLSRVIFFVDVGQTPFDVVEITGAASGLDKNYFAFTRP